MLGHLLLPEIEEMIAAGDLAGLRSALEDLPAADIGEILEELPPSDCAVVFRILPRDLAADTFAELRPEVQEVMLNALNQEDVGRILLDMAPDDRTALLEELPAEATRRLLQLLPPAERTVATQLLGYPEGSVGRRMTPDYVAIRAEWTVSRVLDHVRQHGRDSETLNVLYVTDAAGKLIDDIRVHEFLLSPLDRTVADLMDEEFIALKATDDQETAVEAIRKYGVVALPVTDSTGALVGIVTVDDVLDVAEEEATEDIQKLGGMEALDEPYMTVGMGTMIRKRGGWLVVLFLGEMLTATAMGHYEHQITQAVVLAMFVPLIISSGGNTGSQACTLVIRAMALGEVRLRDWARVMRRELIAGVALGALLGVIGFLRIAIWSVASGGKAYGPHWALVGVTVGVSLLGVVLWGTLSGSMLPFLLKRCKLDPATSSAPFVATLVDVTGLVIYFTVASAVLGGTLLSGSK